MIRLTLYAIIVVFYLFSTYVHACPLCPNGESGSICESCMSELTKLRQILLEMQPPNSSSVSQSHLACNPHILIEDAPLLHQVLPALSMATPDIQSVASTFTSSLYTDEYQTMVSHILTSISSISSSSIQIEGQPWMHTLDQSQHSFTEEHHSLAITYDENNSWILISYDLSTAYFYVFSSTRSKNNLEKMDIIELSRYLKERLRSRADIRTIFF